MIEGKLGSQYGCQSCGGRGARRGKDRGVCCREAYFVGNVSFLEVECRTCILLLYYNHFMYDSIICVGVT